MTRISRLPRRRSNLRPVQGVYLGVLIGTAIWVSLMTLGLFIYAIS